MIKWPNILKSLMEIKLIKAQCNYIISMTLKKYNYSWRDKNKLLCSEKISKNLLEKSTGDGQQNKFDKGLESRMAKD